MPAGGEEPLRLRLPVSLAFRAAFLMMFTMLTLTGEARLVLATARWRFGVADWHRQLVLCEHGIS